MQTTQIKTSTKKAIKTVKPTHQIHPAAAEQARLWDMMKQGASLLGHSGEADSNPFRFETMPKVDQDMEAFLEGRIY